VELVKAIDEVYTEGEIIREVYPFKRSLENVTTGNADFHIPLIKNPLVSEDKLPFRYSSVPTGPVAFVIYSHKDNPISKQDIVKAVETNPSQFPYKIDTLQGHTEFFNFPVIENHDFESALKRVSMKRIDAAIMPQEECDATLRKLNMKEIHRALYYEFDSMIVIPKGPKGDEIDKIITESLKKLKSDGRLDKINDKIHKPYIDWQPYKENGK
jgi:ABC-type amino acid transport substrate-binding protein